MTVILAQQEIHMMLGKMEISTILQDSISKKLPIPVLAPNNIGVPLSGDLCTIRTIFYMSNCFIIQFISLFTLYSRNVAETIRQQLAFPIVAVFEPEIVMEGNFFR